MKRQGMTLVEAVKKFSNEAEAEAWFLARRWPNGVYCPLCNSNAITERKNRKPMPYHCIPCNKDFSVKTKTFMHASKLPLSKWALGFYLYSTHLKGVSSMKLHRDLGITQKSAWHMAHRIRQTWDNGAWHTDGPVEVDETYIGGLERNKHESKKRKEGRGGMGKQAVVGVKSRTSKNVQAVMVPTVSATTLQRAVHEHVENGAMVYSDQNMGYKGIVKHGYTHQSVNHGAKQYVDGIAHTNGIESFWSMLKRRYIGTYHQFSVKHMQRYVDEFAGRHNQRSMDTEKQMVL